MPVEINEMLNGTIPATDAIRCGWCNDWMMPRSAGEPCLSCLEELRHQELLEETSVDYTMLQDGGID